MNNDKKKKIINTSLIFVITGGAFFLGWFWSDILKPEDSIEKYKIEQALSKDKEEANLKKINYIYNYVKNNHIYSDKLDYQAMWENAFESLVAETDGGLTRYIPPVKQDIVDKQINGDYQGNGITIDNNKNNDTIIQSVDENSKNSDNVSTGDKIIAINGQSTKDLTQAEQQKLLSAEGEVEITIQRGTETITQTIYNEIIKIPPTVTSEKVKDNVYLVKIETFNEKSVTDFEEVMKSIPKNSKLIFDVRDNNGGLLSSYKEIMSFLIDKEQILYYESTSSKDIPIKARPFKNNYKISDVVVLINHNSASASELFASNMRDLFGAKIIGTKSYGKATIQSVIDLSDGSYLYITDKQYLTAKKQVVEAVGLTPDVVEVDPALHTKKALELLK